MQTLPLIHMVFRMPSGARDGRQDGEITGPLMFQYLLALLSQAGHGGRNGGPPPIFAELFGNGVEPGRMGDYVFTQDGASVLIRLTLLPRLTVQLSPSAGPDSFATHGKHTIPPRSSF